MRRPFPLRRSLASCALLLVAAGSETALSLAAISCLLAALWAVDPMARRDAM